MLCKSCGAEILKRHKNTDGTVVCPGCGKVYHPKVKNTSSETSSASPKKKRTKKRRKQKNFRYVFPIAAALLVIAAIVFLIMPHGNQTDPIVEPEISVAATVTAVITPTPVPTPEPSPTPTVEPLPPASVHFRAVGDIMSHKLQMRHAYQQDGTFNYDGQFADVRDSLRSADYTIGNLEMSIAIGSDYSSFPKFRVPEEILTTIADCGFDLLTMANNHILDGDFEGLTHTVSAADAHGLDHFGAYSDAQSASVPVIREINGIKFGFLAYTKDVNGNEARLTSDQSKFAVPILEKADFKGDVQRLRDAGAEVIICLPHWGGEGKRTVHPDCKKYAQRMIDAGVDIILGSHPHVVLPIQSGKVTVDGVEKEVLIAWSMGNFISFMDERYMDSGIILDFTVSRDAEGNISIHDVGYVPVYVWGTEQHFELVRSAHYYNDRPEGMSDHEYSRMRLSVREIRHIIGEDYKMLDS